MTSEPTPKRRRAAHTSRILDQGPLPSTNQGDSVEPRTAEPLAVAANESSSELSIARRALENEVRGRHVLERELAECTELKNAARHATCHDSLTGLPNRALFMDRLNHGLALARRHGWSLAVMFLDLDGFKEINDTYGHDAGDRVLRIIAHRLEANARADDTVSRFGGDEFLYLLMGVGDEQNLASIATTIIHAVGKPSEVLVREQVVHTRITPSVGISVFPQHGTTSTVLVGRADEAMYRAKREGTGFALARP